MTTCDRPLQGGGNCTMDANHRGRHSDVTFRCDGCGKTRRGIPFVYGRDGEFELGLAFCFMCVAVGENCLSL